MENIEVIKKQLLALANPIMAKQSARFFKIGKGEYAENDHFIGVSVPNIRKVIKPYKNISPNSIVALLHEKIHEFRFAALSLWVIQFAQHDEQLQREIYELYMANTAYINNWDLVDSSAYKIVGSYLLQRDREPLYKLVNSKNLWEQRIAMVATLYFIRRKDYADTFALATLLITHKHDLIHKAVGWMLREIGKQDRGQLVNFLSEHYSNMPRTALRYAIEHFSSCERQMWLKRGI